MKYIRQRFTGHEFAFLIDALLRAQGYTTHLSSPGPDGGVDILAAPGALGFGSPRRCVKVKSGNIKVDRPTHDQLIGVMQKVGADHGLLVAWGGFKDTVDKERTSQFFRVRLWDADDEVNELLAHYDRLPEDVPTRGASAEAHLDGRERRSGRVVARKSLGAGGRRGSAAPIVTASADCSRRAPLRRFAKPRPIARVAAQ